MNNRIMIYFNNTHVYPYNLKKSNIFFINLIYCPNHSIFHKFIQLFSFNSLIKISFSSSLSYLLLLHLKTSFPSKLIPLPSITSISSSDHFKYYDISIIYNFSGKIAKTVKVSKWKLIFVGNGVNFFMLMIKSRMNIDIIIMIRILMHESHFLLTHSSSSHFFLIHWLHTCYL